MKKNLKICTWNVNGLRAMLKKGELQRLMEKGMFYNNSENPHIICLNEVKLSLDIIPQVEESFNKKYLQYWNTSIEKKGYSGVCTLTKIKPLSVSLGINQKAHDNEGRVLTLEYEKFYLVNIYVPNSGEILKRLDYRTKEWEPSFRTYVKNLLKVKNVILTGDFNVAPNEIDLFNPKGNLNNAGYTVNEREEFKKLLELGLIDCYRYLYPEKVEYTYFSSRGKCREMNKGWRIDHFLINKDLENNLTKCQILSNYMGSDHCPILLNLKF